jgi:hypothetical protein
MTALERLKGYIEEGQAYRREDLIRWSNAVDRHIRRLVVEGFLVKLSGGLYMRPKKTAFGRAPATDKTVVEAFLKDGRFLLASPSQYNMLGLGTTQLYNETVVYNHKRHGVFSIGGRTFRFEKNRLFPTEVTPEFLLVDVVNNIGRLAEDWTMVLEKVRKRAEKMDQDALAEAVREYGSERAKKFFASVLPGINLRRG